MKKSYNDAVTAARKDFADHGELPPADMTEVVCIAPDWDGKVAAAYGASHLDQDVVVVLIGADGAIVGQGRGAQAAETLLGEWCNWQLAYSQKGDES
jgi:hypothetical protein